MLDFFLELEVLLLSTMLILLRMQYILFGSFKQYCTLEICFFFLIKFS